VADGLSYLHDTMKVGNRDIKLENILYLTRDERVKITDFTTAIEVKDDDMTIKDREGTKAFEASECIT
jgi:serine/threonine protein kinase